MKNIIVFFGGESVESDVSVITGLITLNSIDGAKFNACPVFIDERGDWWTGDVLKDIDEYKNLNKKRLKQVTLVAGSNKLYAMRKNKLKELFTVSCAINCTHGGNGENGNLAGLLETHKIPVVCPPALASSIAMDKGITKAMLRGIGVKTLPCITVRSLGDKRVEKIKLPAVVKPARLGSSIGIEVAKTKEELSFALSGAFRFDDKVIVEPLMTGFTEINCACYKMGGDNVIVSECEKPVGKNEVLTFDDKYNVGRRQFPAKIDKSVSDKIKRITEKIYRALEFSGVIRIDYFVDKNGEVFVNEINSIPGSMAYYLFCETLAEFSCMLTALIAQAEKEFSAKSTLIKKFQTSLLSIKGSKGAKRL